jgi:predicted phage terminase large subunit-like protein
MSQDIELTSELIYGFTNALLAPSFDQPVATPNFHMELWELMCRPDPWVAVAAPRGHAKSTAITHCFTLANVCFRVRDHVMIVSDTESQAVSFLGDIKRVLQENEELRYHFGIKGFSKERETEIIVLFEDGHEARLFVKGSEQKMRGAIWKHKRPNLIICDDLENDEIVMNDERRLKFRKWFNEALVPCGSINCQIRVVGTILHLDSLLERMMPLLGATTTIEDGLRQYSTEPGSWKSYRYKAHNEDYSQILWPEQFSEERLKRIRTLYIEQGFPEGYSQEYLNYPIDEATAYFKKKDFLPIVQDSQPLDYYISADLAISQKDRTAYTVFVVAGLSPSGRLKIVDIERFRGDALEIIDTMFALYRRYRPQIVFLEEENIARTLGSVINKEMEVRGIYLPLQLMTASQDKIKRARALQSRMRAGMVEFDTEAEWFPTLQQEFLQFPRSAYMDQVDATSWIALGLDKLYDTPTLQQIEQNQYEEDMEDSEEIYFFGRNATTGY